MLGRYRGGCPPDVCLSLTPASFRTTRLSSIPGAKIMAGSPGGQCREACRSSICSLFPRRGLRRVGLSVPRRRCVAARLGSAVAFSIHQVLDPPFYREPRPWFPRLPAGLSRRSAHSLGDPETVPASTKKRKGAAEKSGAFDAELRRKSAQGVEAIMFLLSSSSAKAEDPRVSLLRE
jgi:hypothetical protein